MPRTVLTRRTVMTALVAMVALAAGAAGDWLVTREGAPVETRGPWEVRGETVVFTSPNGTLSSMSLREVDLARSVELTAARSAPAPPPADQRRPKAVVAIGPDDVPRARPSVAGGQEEEHDTVESDTVEETGEPAGPRPFLDGLRVVDWEKVERPLIDGVEVVGRIRNANRAVAARLVVTVRLLDDDGAVVTSGEAFLDAGALPGGQTLGFRRLFEGVRDFTTAEFEVSAVEVLLGASPAVEEPEP